MPNLPTKSFPLSPVLKTESGHLTRQQPSLFPFAVGAGYGLDGQMLIREKKKAAASLSTSIKRR
jgi:hypothetical protein